MAAASGRDKLRRPNQREAEQLAAASLVLLERAPYLANIWFELDIYVANGLDTFAVDDKWRMYFDPAAMERWGVVVTAGVIEHEIHHALRDHFARSILHGVPDGGAGQLIWNIAADAEINDDLRAVKVSLPEGCVYPDALGLPNGQTAEFYYDNMPRSASDGDGGGGESGNHSEWEPFDGCGSVSGGEPAPCESAAPEGSGRTSADQELAKIATAQAIKERAASGRGTLPGSLVEWANAVLAPPKVPWRQVLQSAIRRSLAHQRGMLDYSWRRPSRREAGPVLRPSMVAPRPRIAVIVDTSGSMSPDMLQSALAEVEGVIRQTGVRGEDLRVLDVDAQVHGSQSVTSARQVKLRGRGGTDIRVGISAAVADKRHSPNVIIVLTDGDTPWPSRPIPNVSVIAAIISDGRTPEPDVPEWIKTVNVDDQRGRST